MLRTQVQDLAIPRASLEKPRRSISLPLPALVDANGFSRKSCSYSKLPEEPIKLSVRKLDGSSFDVEVIKSATIAELKLAVQRVFSHMPKKGPGKISWPHVWGHFCLCYDGLKLLTDTDHIMNYGIKDGDQLHFVRHVSSSYNLTKIQSKKTMVAQKQSYLSMRSSTDIVASEQNGEEDDNIDYGRCKTRNAQLSSSDRVWSLLRGEVMAGKVVNALSASFSEYEFVEGDDDDKLRTVVEASNPTVPCIDPSVLELQHRIGRGPLGDVWLATYRRSTKDCDQYHEVAIKMLHPVKQDAMSTLLDKFGDLYSKCQHVNNICSLHGISIISGKICIIMKFYEGSVGDKMTCLKGGKLPISYVLRYGGTLAQGISELHSKGILVLNLKPFNFLLDETDQAVLGDIGIPYLLLGIRLPSSDTAHRLGTPNYMAPEQWLPEIRGPLSFETDSWGFACSIVEMLTGVVPWHGKSADEIYDLVVRRQEKPLIPSGLPPLVENVLLGCFEYDLRCRPLMKDILHVFNSLEIGGEYDGHSTVSNKTSSNTGSDYTEWFLSKDCLQAGDIVGSRKPPNSCKPENMDVPEGNVVGGTDEDGFVLVRVRGIHDPLRVHVSTLERVTLGLAAGDWVRLKKEDKRHSPVGILHSIDRDGTVAVGFIGLENLWKGSCSQFQMAESYCIGQFVRLKSNVLNPRFGWPHKRESIWATGKIYWILPNGCLVVKFPGRLSFRKEQGEFLADPAEVEVVSFNNCPGLMKKYQHLEDFHWGVRPLAVALGLFTAMKVGFYVGKRIGRSKASRHSSLIHSEVQQMDEQSEGSPAWVPPQVANILFREGAAPAR
ncbi:hypothetical protein V6N11_081378 [Hibiscus sabdariffa]|uniref:Protein kinase domain-containing protein n=1 Tax=Hibiscus sabdariffa TaxID=183260 RepID=A0ABR2QJQ4_9ROSI